MRTAASRTKRSHVPRDVDYVSGRGFERSCGTQAYSSLRDITHHHATPGFCRWQTRVVATAPQEPEGGRSTPRGLQVGVSVELAFIEPLQPLAFRDGHASVPDGPLAVPRQGGVELCHVILHVFEDLVGGVARDDFLDPPAPLVMEP